MRRHWKAFAGNASRSNSSRALSADPVIRDRIPTEAGVIMQIRTDEVRAKNESDDQVSGARARGDRLGGMCGGTDRDLGGASCRIAQVSRYSMPRTAA